MQERMDERVVDAQMPDNQFTSAEQSELMTFTDQREASLEGAIRVLISGVHEEVLIKLL